MDSTQKGIDRRSFLKLGLATPALALGGCVSTDERRPASAPGEMRYRPLGNTGLKISEVSFGAHGIENPELIPAAMDAGINTYYTAAHYLDGNEEKLLGRAVSKLGSRRDEMVLFTGYKVEPGASKQSVLDSFDASLRNLRTDHLDVFCASMIITPDELRIEAIFEAFEEARQAGKVLHLAMSGHSGGMERCLEAALEDGRYEAFFIKYDFASFPGQDAIIRRAAERGIGTLVFKTNAGNRQREIKDLEAGGLSFRQAAVKWALGNPDVVSVAVSLSSFDDIREATAAVGAPLAGSEERMLRRYAGEMYNRYCRFCGTCEGSCPHGVAVADVMRYAMYFKYYGREKRSMQLYDGLPRRSTAAACQDCPGPCDTACPFGRAVRSELVEAHRLLSYPGIST
jgi:aryl-alcohol dehydrogenase-like predicted oxidoreductase